ncbi:MAG: hypothetical protein KKA42_00055 [candidate division Zixibacteria bacterium]|nr:hypothetical protein [candidate division Zixibacteria bacterium]
METKFKKSTDSEHTIKLESRIVSAAWKGGQARAGRPAAFEVRTLFVGDGAPIKITGKSDKGLKLGKLKLTMLGNRCAATLDIPVDAELNDKVYFEYELSKNDLDGESNRIPVQPVVRATNMKWSTKEARRGDTVTLTADVSGLRDHTEVTVTIYEHDQDKAHDRIVEIPGKIMDQKLEVQWEYEYHEDTDDIPTQVEMDRYGGKYQNPEYFFTIKTDESEFGKAQESGLLLFKDWLEIECEDAYGEVAADADYKVTFADGTEKTGKLDSQGKATVKDVPPGACEIEVTPAKSDNDDTQSASGTQS